MLDNHSLVFNGMMTKLRIEETIQQNGNCDFNKGFNDMAESLFAQNEVKPIYLKYLNIYPYFDFISHITYSVSITINTFLYV